jgi:hypothetical protein
MECNIKRKILKEFAAKEQIIREKLLWKILNKH